MRIYEGSPRQDWEEVLRSIGAFADGERLKEILLLELDEGFVLQGLAMQAGGADSDSFGALTKRTYELTEERVAELMEIAAGQRGTAPDDRPHPDLTNYYELSLRILGAYIDSQKARDVFFLEQEGTYVLRLYGASGSLVGHQLSEFTRDEMLAMIEGAPEHRQQPAPETTGAQ